MRRPSNGAVKRWNHVRRSKGAHGCCCTQISLLRVVRLLFVVLLSSCVGWWAWYHSLRRSYHYYLANPGTPAAAAVITITRSTKNASANSLSSSSSSLNATVIGLATGYDRSVLERFVGSLRKTGYAGHIILGVAPNAPPDVLNYLRARQVMVQQLVWTPCEYEYTVDPPTRIVCAAPYANLKLCWGRYPLARDWLQQCDTCTGPVLFTDVRDVIFQRDPFGGGITVDGLQLFAEHPYQTTLHKLVKKPLWNCQHIKLNQPMLCSGTTVGTRVAMLEYLTTMHTEMNAWALQERCRMVHHEGGDQAIHNYVYYMNKLPASLPTRVIPFGSGGIVNTVAVWGNLLHDEIQHMQNNNNNSLIISSWTQMARYNVTDAEGFFIEANGGGVRSRVVHQFNRFYWAGYDQWLQEQGLDRDFMA